MASSVKYAIPFLAAAFCSCAEANPLKANKREAENAIPARDILERVGEKEFMDPEKRRACAPPGQGGSAQLRESSRASDASMNFRQ